MPSRYAWTSSAIVSADVYLVVIRVDDAPSAERVARRHGAVTRFRQHRQVGAHQLEEIELSVQGLSLTLLSTDLP